MVINKQRKHAEVICHTEIYLNETMQTPCLFCNFWKKEEEEKEETPPGCGASESFVWVSHIVQQQILA